MAFGSAPNSELIDVEYITLENGETIKLIHDGQTGGYQIATTGSGTGYSLIALDDTGHAISLIDETGYPVAVIDNSGTTSIIETISKPELTAALKSMDKTIFSVVDFFAPLIGAEQAKYGISVIANGYTKLNSNFCHIPDNVFQDYIGPIIESGKLDDIYKIIGEYEYLDKIGITFLDKDNKICRELIMDEIDSIISTDEFDSILEQLQEKFGISEDAAGVCVVEYLNSRGIGKTAGTAVVDANSELFNTDYARKITIQRIDDGFISVDEDLAVVAKIYDRIADSIKKMQKFTDGCVDGNTIEKAFDQIRICVTEEIAKKLYCGEWSNGTAGWNNTYEDGSHIIYINYEAVKESKLDFDLECTAAHEANHSLGSVKEVYGLAFNEGTTEYLAEKSLGLDHERMYGYGCLPSMCSKLDDALKIAGYENLYKKAYYTEDIEVKKEFGKTVDTIYGEEEFFNHLVNDMEEYLEFWKNGNGGTYECSLVIRRIYAKLSMLKLKSMKYAKTGE